jgi:hypothetical protein
MTTPIPLTAKRGPQGLDFDAHSRCWWGSPGDEDNPPTWTLARQPSDGDTHWVPFGDLPDLESLHDEPDTWASHPSLTAEQRNPSLVIR